MARLEDMERRLLNWARWWNMRDSGSIGFAKTTFRDRVDCEGYDAPAIVPTNDDEAQQTEVAVLTLDRALQDTLRRVYVQPRGARENARLLGVSEASVKERVERAQRKLSSHFAEQARSARQERERVEKLQRLAAQQPKGSFPT